MRCLARAKPETRRRGCVMFARIVRSKVQPGKTDEALEFFQSGVFSSIKTREGFLGALVLLNREASESLGVTYWQDALSMGASEESTMSLRPASAMAGLTQIIDIERFELMLQDRAAPVQVGSYVRLNDMIAAVPQIDALVAYVRDTVLPTARGIDGYRATLVGANRTTGRMLVSTVWASAEVWAHNASEAVLGGQRQQADKISQAQWVRLTEYETVFAEVSAAAQASITAPTV